MRDHDVDEGHGPPREVDGREGWQEQPDADYAAGKVELTREQIAAFGFGCAGLGAGAVMSKDGPAGEVVMPTEEIGRGVSDLLGELPESIDVGRIPGYGGRAPAPALGNLVAGAERGRGDA